MELKTHLQLLRDTAWFIVLMTVLAGVATGLWMIVKPLSYDAQVSFEVQLVNRGETKQYEYGVYYDLKGAEMYTQHLMSLLKSPAVVEEIYTTAGMGYEIDSISRFTGRFRAKQFSSEHFVVEFGDLNPDTAKKLGDAVATVISTHAQAAGSIDSQPQFIVTPSDTVVAGHQTPLWMTVVAGLLGGFVLSLLLVYLREYLRS